MAFLSLPIFWSMHVIFSSDTGVSPRVGVSERNSAWSSNGAGGDCAARSPSTVPGRPHRREAVWVLVLINEKDRLGPIRALSN